MKTIITNEEPYGEVLSRYFQQEFPTVGDINTTDLLEILTTIIVGTKEVRYGPIPPAEGLVVIRKAIKTAIDNQAPIPILVPWGSIKANFSPDIDVAEISAINRLSCLVQSIKKYYPIGVEMIVRIEDQSGYTLFALEGDQSMIKANIDSYSEKFFLLFGILLPENVLDSITPILESNMKNAEQFNIVFKENVSLMEDYLVDSMDIVKNSPKRAYDLPSYQNLLARGWRGIISTEQRMHYLSAYERLYPDWHIVTMIKRLALYFAGALTRHQLGMTGKQSHWTDFIQLAFIPPIKGLPEGYNHNYIYYRTLPMSSARTHIPAWRAKGYFKIQGNTLTPKLTTFSDAELIQKLIPASVSLSNGINTVRVQTDYLLED